MATKKKEAAPEVTVRCLVNTSIAGAHYSYGGGGIYDIPESIAKSLITGGIATKLKPEDEVAVPTTKKKK